MRLLLIIVHLYRKYRHRRHRLRLAATLDLGGGNTITARNPMDLLLHQGMQQKLQLDPETRDGAKLDFTGTEAETISDPSIVTVAHNPHDPSQIAIASVGALGSTTVTITYTNPDGVQAVLVINVMVVAPDATRLEAEKLGDEEPAGTPFPEPPPPESAPVVTGLSPATGAGGTGVAISGSGFARATAVKFGAVGAAGFTIDSDAGITATSPLTGLTAGDVVDVTVVNAAGSSEVSDASKFTVT